MEELLKQDKFKFTTDEKIAIDRRHAPFPKDLDEAEAALAAAGALRVFAGTSWRAEITETNGIFTVKLPADANTNIIATLEKHYRWNLHLMTNQDSDAVLQAYLNALAHAYDPHSDYFSAPHAQDFSIGMNLSLFGIGAQLTEDDGYCTIRSLVPRRAGEQEQSRSMKKTASSPSRRAASRRWTWWTWNWKKSSSKSAGPKGTEVRLTISPGADRPRARWSRWSATKSSWRIPRPRPS